MKKSFVILFCLSLFFVGCGGEESTSEDAENAELIDTTSDDNEKINESSDEQIFKDDQQSCVPSNSQVVDIFSKLKPINSDLFGKPTSNDTLVMLNPPSDIVWSNSDNGTTKDSARIFIQTPVGVGISAIDKYRKTNINSNCNNNEIVVEFAIEQDTQITSVVTNYIDVVIETNEWVDLNYITILFVNATTNKKKKKVIAAHPRIHPKKKIN